jgi:proton glutamate symport protein
MKQLTKIALGITFLATLIMALQGAGFLGLTYHTGLIIRWLGVIGLIVFAYERKSLTTWILISLVIGAAIGYDSPILSKMYDIPNFAQELDALSKIFLKLIKTLVAPLLFATLVTGIAGNSDSKQLGRLGIKSFGYFITVTTIALFFGLVAINLTKAGYDEGISKEKAQKQSGKATSVKKNWKEVAAPMVMERAEKMFLAYETAPDSMKNGIVQSGIDSMQVSFAEAKKIADKAPEHKFKDFLINCFPENIAKAIGENQVLQVVIFSILFALGITKVEEEHRRRMLNFCESLTQVMFKFTNFVMYLAPLGVLGAMAAAVSTMGLDVFIPMLKLIGTLYLALFFFIIIVFGGIVAVMRINVFRFWNAVKEPVSIAFSTASSEAALGPAMTALRAYGVPEKYVSFVLPTGMSFNLDGTTLYLSCAAIFVAQATHHPIATDFTLQLSLLATLLISSKGVAGVARASLIILMGTIGQFGIEEWPIYLILAVDVLMDMVRTGTNMLGNCLATVVIAKWEGEKIDEI